MATSQDSTAVAVAAPSALARPPAAPSGAAPATNDVFMSWVFAKAEQLPPPPPKVEVDDKKKKKKSQRKIDEEKAKEPAALLAGKIIHPAPEPNFYLVEGTPAPDLPLPQSFKGRTYKTYDSIPALPTTSLAPELPPAVMVPYAARTPRGIVQHVRQGSLDRLALPAGVAAGPPASANDAQVAMDFFAAMAENQANGGGANGSKTLTMAGNSGGYVQAANKVLIYRSPAAPAIEAAPETPGGPVRRAAAAAAALKEFRPSAARQRPEMLQLTDGSTPGTAPDGAAGPDPNAGAIVPAGGQQGAAAAAAGLRGPDAPTPTVGMGSVIKIKRDKAETPTAVRMLAAWMSKGEEDAGDAWDKRYVEVRVANPTPRNAPGTPMHLKMFDRALEVGRYDAYKREAQALALYKAPPKEVNGMDMDRLDFIYEKARAEHSKKLDIAARDGQVKRDADALQALSVERFNTAWDTLHDKVRAKKLEDLDALQRVMEGRVQAQHKKAVANIFEFGDSADRKAKEHEAAVQQLVKAHKDAQDAKIKNFAANLFGASELEEEKQREAEVLEKALKAKAAAKQRNAAFTEGLFGTSDSEMRREQDKVMLERVWQQQQQMAQRQENERLAGMFATPEAGDAREAEQLARRRGFAQQQHQASANSTYDNEMAVREAAAASNAAANARVVATADAIRRKEASLGAVFADFGGENSTSTAIVVARETEQAGRRSAFRKQQQDGQFLDMFGRPIDAASAAALGASMAPMRAAAHGLPPSGPVLPVDLAREQVLIRLDKAAMLEAERRRKDQLAAEELQNQIFTGQAEFSKIIDKLEEQEEQAETMRLEVASREMEEARKKRDAARSKREEEYQKAMSQRAEYRQQQAELKKKEEGGPSKELEQHKMVLLKMQQQLQDIERRRAAAAKADADAAAADAAAEAAANAPPPPVAAATVRAVAPAKAAAAVPGQPVVPPLPQPGAPTKDDIATAVVAEREAAAGNGGGAATKRKSLFSLKFSTSGQKAPSGSALSSLSSRNINNNDSAAETGVGYISPVPSDHSRSSESLAGADTSPDNSPLPAVTAAKPLQKKRSAGGFLPWNREPVEPAAPTYKLPEFVAPKGAAAAPVAAPAAAPAVVPVATAKPKLAEPVASWVRDPKAAATEKKSKATPLAKGLAVVRPFGKRRSSKEDLNAHAAAGVGAGRHSSGSGSDTSLSPLRSTAETDAAVATAAAAAAAAQAAADTQAAAAAAVEQAAVAQQQAAAAAAAAATDVTTQRQGSFSRASDSGLLDIDAATIFDALDAAVEYETPAAAATGQNNGPAENPKAGMLPAPPIMETVYEDEEEEDASVSGNSPRPKKHAV